MLAEGDTRTRPDAPHRARTAATAPAEPGVSGAATQRSWPMGEDMWLTAIRHHGVIVTGRGRPTSSGADRQMLVAATDSGTWTCGPAPAAVAHRECALAVADLSHAFDLRIHHPGTVIMVRLPAAWLNLPSATTDRGAVALEATTSLVPFLCSHLRQLGEIGARHPQALPDVATPTVALIRSALLSSAHAPSPTADLVSRVKTFVDAHLTDVGLSADMIATHHNISPRTLYARWPASEPRLGDYIIRRRLDRARDVLITHRHLTIPAVARAHGFRDPTHFTKRFRAAYGITPSQWRRDTVGP